MKRLIAIFVILFSVLVFCSKEEKNTPTQPGPSSNLSWLSVSGNKIIDENGEQVLLYGVNRSGLEYDKNGNRMSQGEFQYIIQDWGAKIIRLPFNEDWVLNDEAYSSKLDQVIDWIKSLGAYVLLDLQWQNTQVRIPPIPDSAAIDMWKQLAERYKDEPAVLYDIHNEAHDVGISQWRARASEIIEAIQSVHHRALILVSGLNWASDISEWAKNPLPYSNIVYSVHVYPWMGNKNSWGQKFGNYSEQLPMFVGEFGGYAEHLDWGKELITYLRQKKIGWTAWSWVDDPHLTQDDHVTPTEFGALVRSYLQRYASPEEYSNQIFDVQVQFISSDRATIYWKTKLESDSRVLYGLTEQYTDSVYAPIFLTVHTMKLTNLLADTTYHFKIQSTDDLGFVTETNDSTFSTLKP
ncbi:MAG: cellulase family glycosylhydrolase [Calditrichaeota bacterium]|nr:cellulase family glycosylhydrolase [Calditrichota bacterium]